MAKSIDQQFYKGIKESLSKKNILPWIFYLPDDPKVSFIFDYTTSNSESEPPIRSRYIYREGEIDRVLTTVYPNKKEALYARKILLRDGWVETKIKREFNLLSETPGFQDG